MARVTRRSPQSLVTAAVLYETGTNAGFDCVKPAYAFAPFSCSHLALSSLATLSVGSAAGAGVALGASFSFDFEGALTWAIAGDRAPAVPRSAIAASTMTGRSAQIRNTNEFSPASCLPHGRDGRHLR